ncbi:MAG: hypothetical protein JWN52_632 [Actinomycetia bacterium]|nr:hypothetical protein [Actinomycetes bacterium]
MYGARRLLLLGLVLLTALTFLPAEASQASIGPRSANVIAVNAPNTANIQSFKPCQAGNKCYDAGYSDGYDEAYREVEAGSS